MSYQKTYGRINWENYPSDKTPLNEANLNKIDYAVNEVDNRVLELDIKKLDLAVANGMVKSLTYNQANGVFTITYLNGSSDTIDTKLEKLAVNFSYDPTAQQLIITLDDGTTQKVDLSALITQYEFSDTDTVAFSTDGGGKVSANVKNGSITEDKLRPNYLADIKVEVAKAQSSAAAAASSETNAKASENAAKTSETNAKTSETNAAGSASTASAKAAAAADSASAAAASESNALNSAKTASDKATEASNSATTATSKANEASASASNAASSASAAASKASEASDCATEAESYAHGGTGTRQGEDTDNAAYYYHQSKSISESFAGALRPMGTVTFASLPSLENVTSGDMYNISDEFTTTAEFKEGSGNVIPAGANVYKTADGYWDVLAGSPVTGVKGDAEADYHRGNVNITPENIGLGNVPNVTTNDQTPTFTQASARQNLVSGEKISTLFGKIMKWFADLKTVAFTGSYNDLSDKPSIPAAVAVKGNAESSYRTGNVNLTPANIGALSLGGGVVNGETQFLSNVYFKTNIHVIYNMIWKQLHAYDDSRDSIIWDEPITIQDKNGNRVGYISMRYNTEGGADLTLGADHGSVIIGGVNNGLIYDYINGILKSACNFNMGGYGIYNCDSAIAGTLLAKNVVECSKGIFSSTAGYIELRASGSVRVLSYDGRSYIPIAASAFNTQSSKRYKKNIEDLSEERAKKLLDLRVVTFDYINEANGTDCIGLIAEETEDVEKYPVYYNQDGEPDSIDYSKLVPQLIKLVQMQQKQIDELKQSLSQCMKIIVEGHTEQTE